MGLDGLLDTGARAGPFQGDPDRARHARRGSPEWMAEAFLKTTGGDPEALLPLLDSFVDTSEAELREIAMPTLVLSGADDQDNGSAEALAELLPDARLCRGPRQPYERGHQARSRPARWPTSRPLTAAWGGSKSAAP